MALGWIGFTMLFGSVVRKANSSCWPGRGVRFDPRTPSQRVQMPAKKNSGWLSSRANQ